MCCICCVSSVFFFCCAGTIGRFEEPDHDGVEDGAVGVVSTASLSGAKSLSHAHPTVSAFNGVPCDARLRAAATTDAAVRLGSGDAQTSAAAAASATAALVFDAVHAVTDVCVAEVMFRMRQGKFTGFDSVGGKPMLLALLRNACYMTEAPGMEGTDLTSAAAAAAAAAPAATGASAGAGAAAGAGGGFATGAAGPQDPVHLLPAWEVINTLVHTNDDAVTTFIQEVSLLMALAAETCGMMSTPMTLPDASTTHEDDLATLPVALDGLYAVEWDHRSKVTDSYYLKSKYELTVHEDGAPSKSIRESDNLTDNTADVELDRSPMVLVVPPQSKHQVKMQQTIKTLYNGETRKEQLVPPVLGVKVRLCLVSLSLSLSLSLALSVCVRVSVSVCVCVRVCL